ncbi:MAG: GbsR/MarR family transcriptional regulator [Pseudomonadota bacterium]
MEITSYQQAFVLHFGEMGNRWGINRTVGQIYALLYVSESPLNADDITGALSISRSNTSMGLKELQAWGLVRLQHQPGDRRDYFSALEDIWEIFQVLLAERRKREIEPTLSMIRGALMTEQTDGPDVYAQKQLQEMLDLIELVMGWFDEVSAMDREMVVKMMRLGSGVQKLLGGAQRFKRMRDN